MHSIIEIDIGGTRIVSLDKAACARPCERMRRLVVDCRVRFHLDNDSRTIIPNQFCADQLARAGQRITFKKRRADNLVHFRDASYLMDRCFLSISIVYRLAVPRSCVHSRSLLLLETSSYRWLLRWPRSQPETAASNRAARTTYSRGMQIGGWPGPALLACN